MRNSYQFSPGRVLYGLIALILSSSPLLAQDEPEMDPVSRTYAITNTTIIQAPGRKIEAGTVVIKNGLIQSVGKGISIPPEAIIIKGDSLYLYAGFIDGLSHAGVTKPREEQGRDRPKDPGNPTPERAGITPQLSVRESLNPLDKSAEELRSVGFTTVHAVPYGGMLPGQGSLVLLSANPADNTILQNNLSLYSELTPADRVYPATVMGVMAKYRELYRQATLARDYRSVYASNRSGLERPATDRTTESFFPVIDKRQAVLFKAQGVLEIQQVLALQKDLGFNLILGDVKEGWDIISKIKGSGAKVFLSLDLPEEKKKEEKAAGKKDGDKKEEKKDEKPKSAADLEKEVLEKRKADFIAKYAMQASAFQKAGIKFGFSALSAKPKDIAANLRRMIAAGLSEDAALASLTTAPAELLGVFDRLGSVDNGKIANLVISDKPYFNEKAKVRYVFVDGRLFTQEVKDTKKADPNAKAELSGNWTLTTETPQGKSENTLSIKKDGTTYTGKISGGLLPETKVLGSVELNGNEFKFTFSITIDGSDTQVTVSGTIDGDTLKGSSAVGSVGTYPLEGKRDPKF